jgi:transposase
LRYPSDLTDEEWALVEPLIAPAKRGGNRRHVVVREVVNGLMYILSTGCQWRAIAKDLPPRSTLYEYFDLWVHDALYALCRPGLRTAARGARGRHLQGFCALARLVWTALQ